jgi:hypothetical protein
MVASWYGEEYHSSSFSHSYCGQKFECRDEILQPVVVPLFTANPRLTFFQQDNARCHVARICIDFLQQQNLALLPWPAVSPDLSPIDHLSENLDRRIRRRNPQTLGDLWTMLVQEWDVIPQFEIQILIRSMRRHCVAVRDASGGHTRF